MEQAAARATRRWLIHGRVQGVGFRYFVQNRAATLNLDGWVRNLADGEVEVEATGSGTALDQLAAALHAGPPHSEVRRVHAVEAEAAPTSARGFYIR